MVGCSDELVGDGHLVEVVYLSGVYKQVAAHDGLVLGDGRGSLVEVVHLYQAAALDVVKTSLGQRLSDVGIVGWHAQLDGVFIGCLESRFGSLSVGQQTAHGND